MKPNIYLELSQGLKNRRCQFLRALKESEVGPEGSPVGLDGEELGLQP